MLQPDNPLAALLDRRGIRVVQLSGLRDHLWAVDLAPGPGNRVIFSGLEAEARAYEYAELRARELVAVTD